MLVKITIWAYLITIPFNLWFIALAKSEMGKLGTSVKIFIYTLSILASPMLFMAVQLRVITQIIKNRKHEK